MIGYDSLIKTFKKLIKEEKLSHSYIFFGEPQVGKFSFATALAMYLERGEFEIPEFDEEGNLKTPLTELFIIAPDEKGVIGIDAVRSIRHFLSQKPIESPRRVAVIDNADVLTAQAQHAILKIAEEPPGSSLLILITQNSDSLLATVRSRFQKIYFPRISSELIEELLIESGTSKKAAKEIAEISFGRPGRAMDVVSGKDKEILSKVKSVLGKKNKRAIIEEVIERPEDLESFFVHLIAELAKDPITNYDSLRSVLHRKMQMNQYQTNKRLQLEEALWTI